MLQLAQLKFRCQKLKEDRTHKIPSTGTLNRLCNLSTLMKSTSGKKVLVPLKELKRSKGTSSTSSWGACAHEKPLSKEPIPFALPPAKRKWVASIFVPRHEMVQRSLDMSTLFEEPMDLKHSNTRIPARSSKHCAGDASKNFSKDDTVLGPSSADFFTDQRGTVISPQC